MVGNSPSQQGGCFKHCVLFPPKSSRITLGVLVALPMQKYNKATGRQGYLALHDQSQYHKDAVMLSLAFYEAVDNPETTLPYKISAMAKETYDRNFHILKVITKAIILCGKQNIPLRGHRDDYTSVATNKGNFIAILQALSENDEIMMHHLEHGKRNAMCTSKTTQNEIIEVLASYIRKRTTIFLKCVLHFTS